MTAEGIERRTPVIIDCDPGHDDALALLLACASPELRVLGVTTVAGNARLPDATRNALQVLTLLGRTELPVAAGAAGPLVRPLEVAAHVHGESGLEGADLPEPSFSARPEGAVELMERLIGAAPGPVTLVPTGPLTNIALLLERRPELASRIRHVCLMGGAIGEGNITPRAEFNIWVDPEAAQRVFGSGLPITMIGLDVTHQALFSLADCDRLAALGNRSGPIFADLLRFFARFHRERYGWDGAPIHDAVAVAHVLDRGLVETRPAMVRVMLAPDQERGRTVAGMAAGAGVSNAAVGVALDRERFVELLIRAVASAP